MPNRPDLHFNTTFTQGTPPEGDPSAPLTSVEDQPADEQLVNPRNFKTFSFSGRPYWAWQGFIAPDPIVVRYLQHSTNSYLVSTSGEDQLNFPYLPDFVEKEGGYIDKRTGEITGNQNPYDIETLVASGGESPNPPPGWEHENHFAVTETGRTQTAVTFRVVVTSLIYSPDDFPPPKPEGWGDSTKTWELTTSFRTAWPVVDLAGDRDGDLQTLIASGLIEQIPDGHNQEFVFDGATDSFSLGGDPTPISEYLVDVNEVSHPHNLYEVNSDWHPEFNANELDPSQGLGRGSGFFSHYFIWTIPLGGFVSFGGNPHLPAEQMPGIVPVPVSESTNPVAVLYRGDYVNGTNAPADVALPVGEVGSGGVIILPPSFHPQTDFSQINYPGVSQGNGISMRLVRQLRLFEDMPYVHYANSRLALVNIIGTYVDIYGLWLPAMWVNGHASLPHYKLTFQDITGVVNGGAVFEPGMESGGPGVPQWSTPDGTNSGASVEYPFDTLATKIIASLHNIYAGSFHVRVETHLGYWDSRDYPEYAGKGLFKIDGQP